MAHMVCRTRLVRAGHSSDTADEGDGHEMDMGTTSCEQVSVGRQNHLASRFS